MKLPNNFLDIVKHKPSGKKYLVYYVTHNYSLKPDTTPFESKYTNYWGWNFFSGLGQYGGSFIELEAERFTRKWFIQLFKIKL